MKERSRERFFFWIFTKHCSKIILLLCTGEAGRVKHLDENTGSGWLKSIESLIWSVSCGSSTHVTSRTKFFVTTFNGWESLIVETKISILVALGVLDEPLCEIKISKLNKQQTSETGYYLSLNEKTLYRISHLRCSSNLCLTAIIKII